MIERVVPRLGTDVEQDADVGVERLSEGVEEPPMRVQLFLVLLLETENHLARHDALLGALEPKVRVKTDLRGILVYVGGDLSLVDEVLGDAILIDAHGRQSIQGPCMDLTSAIRDDTDDDLLPTIFAPGARFRSGTEMRDVLHDRMHGSSKVQFVLIVHGHADEQLRLSGGRPEVLSQFVAPLDEIVRIAGDSGVA